MDEKKVRFGLYITEEMADEIRTIAAEQKRSQPQQIAWILQQYINEYLRRTLP